jgi:hypothetical protein
LLGWRVLGALTLLDATVATAAAAAAATAGSTLSSLSCIIAAAPAAVAAATAAAAAAATVAMALDGSGDIAPPEKEHPRLVTLPMPKPVHPVRLICDNWRMERERE